jgi:hypothetical protein
MRKSGLRVVFDTNTFTPDHFERLTNGPLVHLCQAGRIGPVYGHVFLEEMFRAYGNEKRRPHLVERWIPFITKTVHRFCEDFIVIWHRELVQGYGRKTNIYMRPRDQAAVVRSLANVPLDGSWKAWHASQKQLAEENAKRAAQREVSKEIRQEVADKLKAAGYNKKQHGPPIPFQEFLAREIDPAGRGLIQAQVKCHNPDAVWNRWSRDKSAYPYFTAFVKNMTYAGYFSATRPNDAIDLNAQADLDLMTHLLRADALVTNETGFMRKAFEDLWRPRGKVVFTSQEFAEFIRKL